MSDGPPAPRRGVAPATVDGHPLHPEHNAKYESEKVTDSSVASSSPTSRRQEIGWTQRRAWRCCSASRGTSQRGGGSIIGFDSYHYVGKGGGEGDWFVAGVSPRKQNLTLYMLGGWTEEALLEKLGKHSLGKGCLYIRHLGDVDLKALERLVADGLKQARVLLGGEKRLTLGSG